MYELLTNDTISPVSAACKSGEPETNEYSLPSDSHKQGYSWPSANLRDTNLRDTKKSGETSGAL